MKSPARLVAGTALLLLASAPLALAQKEDVPDHKLSEWSFGKTIHGEKVTAASLKGKVVAIEYWGIN